MEFVKLSHPHPKVPEYVSIYSRALYAVLGGASVRQQAEHALRRLDVWDTCQSYSCKAARYEKMKEASCPLWTPGSGFSFMAPNDTGLCNEEQL